jgi:hypothetical protein
MALDMNMGGLSAMMGEDTMEGALGGGTGIKSNEYQIPVNLPRPGGLGQAAPGGLGAAKQDYLKATQDMITALERRISGEGYDVSRLLFAFGQPTGTGSIGSALANLGAEASRQRGEQEKNIPSMMKMRTELAANRVALAQQEEAERRMAALRTAPGANVQARPGSGLEAEAALSSGQAQPATLLTMPMDQIEQMFGDLGASGQEKINQILKMREDARKNIVPAGDGSFMDLSTMRRIENPTAQDAPIEREFNLMGFSGKLTLPVSAWRQVNAALVAKDPQAAANIVLTFYPGLANQLGIPAAQPSAQPAAQPAAQPTAQPSPQTGYRSPEQREQERKAAEEQSKADIGMLSGEVKEARSPILTRYDKADSLQQEAKQMMQLASAYPYAVGIFNKPGGQYALAQFIKEGIRVGGTNVTIGGFEDGMRRLVRANPEMVARVAKERGISNDEAQKYLQQQGLDAASLLLQSERRLDSLLNKAERKGEGQVSNYERVLFGQLLPSLSNDPIKAYLVKTLALQEMAKFDKQVGDLLRRRSEAKQYDPRQMYDSDEYKRIRANYVNALDGSMREFFPEMRGKLAEARKVAGV